jgi:hypothetical protein
MNELVFLEGFEGTVQCYFVGFLKLMFKFSQADSRGLLCKHSQNQFAHGGWFDVTAVDEVIVVFCHDVAKIQILFGEEYFFKCSTDKALKKCHQ